MTVSSPALVYALIAFLVIHTVLALLRFAAMRRQHAREQSGNDRIRNEMAENDARIKDNITRNEEITAQHMQLYARAEQLQTKAEAHQERWDKLLNRIEKLTDHIERERDA